MRGICDEKMRHLCDSQSCLPSVIRIETPSGLFSLSFLSVGEEKQQGGARAEREGSYRWPFGLSVWCLGWLSNRETGREGQKERCGCFWVKLELWKEKKKRGDVFISSLVCLVAPGTGFSPWPHLLAHCLVTAKCVKTPPTRSWRWTGEWRSVWVHAVRRSGVSKVKQPLVQFI